MLLATSRNLLLSMNKRTVQALGTAAPPGTSSSWTPGGTLQQTGSQLHVPLKSSQIPNCLPSLPCRASIPFVSFLSRLVQLFPHTLSSAGRCSFRTLRCRDSVGQKREFSGRVRVDLLMPIKQFQSVVPEETCLLLLFSRASCRSVRKQWMNWRRSFKEPITKSATPATFSTK